LQDLICSLTLQSVGVENNPARIAASTHFRSLKIPVIFTAVSADDHGYVFVQENSGPYFGCLFPDAIDSRPMRALRLLPLPTSKQLGR